MNAIWQVLLALLAAVGLLALGWLTFGRLLTPVGGGGAWTAASPWQTRRGCSWMRSAPPLDKGEKLA